MRLFSTRHTLRTRSTLRTRHTAAGQVGNAVAVAILIGALEIIIRHVGFFHNRQAVVWPTNGLTLALLLRSDRRRWPIVLAGVTLGMVVGQLHFSSTFWAKLVNLAANLAGPLLAAFLLPHFHDLEEWMQEPRLVRRFIIYALVSAPLLSATIYSLGLHLLPLSGFLFLFEVRALSNMLGYALFAPLALILSCRSSYRFVAVASLPKTILLLGIVGGATILIFGQDLYALSFVPTSLLLLVTLRLGFATSVVSVNLLALIAIAETMSGHGPFELGGGASFTARIVLLQSFLTLNMIAVFVTSVTQVERQAFQEKLKQAYEEMEHLARIDALTGISNRRGFEEFFRVEWTRAHRAQQPISLLMIDVDHFKGYNDRFGHPAGDGCLREVAQTILSLGRRSTDLLARYGGEEFAFILTSNTAESATSIAEAIRAKVASLYPVESELLKEQVTVSIGCTTLLPVHGMLPERLIAISDEALYRAKQNGRNRVELGFLEQHKSL